MKITYTDSDQIQINISPVEFLMAEIREIGDEYAILKGTIDLELYSSEDAKEVIESYYGSLDRFFEDYKSLTLVDLAGLIAEMLFESIPTNELDVLKTFDSYDKAYDYFKDLKYEDNKY